MPSVRDVILQHRSCCSTAAVRGLSQQIITEMNRLIPGGVLVALDDLPVRGDGSTVNLVLQIGRAHV